MGTAGVRIDDRRPARRVHPIELVSQGVHLNSKLRLAGVRSDDRRPERRGALPSRDAGRLIHRVDPAAPPPYRTPGSSSAFMIGLFNLHRLPAACVWTPLLSAVSPTTPQPDPRSWVGLRKVDIRLPGKGNSNSHGAQPVHQKHRWIRTSRLSIKNSLSRVEVGNVGRGGREGALRNAPLAICPYAHEGRRYFNPNRVEN